MRDQKDRELSIPNFFFLPPWNSSSTCGRAFPRTKRRTKRRMANWSDRGLRPRARFDFLPGPGMRAHLRQIVNTFIHVRQPRVLYSVVALDNETGAFWPFSRRRIARNTRVAQRDVSPTKIYFIVETTISSFVFWFLRIVLTSIRHPICIGLSISTLFQILFIFTKFLINKKFFHYKYIDIIYRRRFIYYTYSTR